MTYSHYQHAINYSGYIFPFERDFDPSWTTWYLQNHWYHSIIASIIYVILVYLGLYLMSERSPLVLDKYLKIWNYLLAAFSTMGAIRTSFGMHHVIANHGFLASVCWYNPKNNFLSYWLEKFTYSKMVELGDTAFLILRKRYVM